MDFYEPFHYDEDADRLRLTFGSRRIERDATGCHWYDASGRWELHGETVSDVFVVHVPVQEGVDQPVYCRHEVMTALGNLDGVEATGFAHQDDAYGPPGKVYAELPIALVLQGMWVSWMHQFDDGEIGGGCFWQRRARVRPRIPTQAGNDDGSRRLVATPAFNAQGKIIALAVTIDQETYTFEFDTAGSFLHFFGRLTETSAGKRPIRSWCWVEYAGGMMTPKSWHW